ncbi:MAG: FIG01000472: hypothetical protein, partial [uncultured Corynebacteriales bacterium]
AADCAGGTRGADRGRAGLPDRAPPGDPDDLPVGRERARGAGRLQLGPRPRPGPGHHLGLVAEGGQPAPRPAGGAVPGRRRPLADPGGPGRRHRGAGRRGRGRPPVRRPLPAAPGEPGPGRPGDQGRPGAGERDPTIL